MALVLLGYELVLSIADSGDNRTNRTFTLLSADATEAAADSATIMARYQAAGDGVIVGYSINEKHVENALALPASAEIENQAFFSGHIVGDPTDSANFSIPAPKASIFTAAVGKGRNIVNMSAAPVVDYVNIFAGAGALASISDGEQLDAPTVSGKRRHVKSNKG